VKEAHHAGGPVTTPVDLYNNVYGDFASEAEASVRKATYGEDLGQSSWLTAAEWLTFADYLGVTAASEVLEVGSGSGGPAVYLAQARACRVIGVDINEHGVRNAGRLADARGVAGRVQFQCVDASPPLPFPAARFDAVLSNDAICHMAQRLSVLRDWHRVSIGFYLFVPPGENERLIGEAGFDLLAAHDVTGNAALVSRRWHDARAAHRDALVAREGEANFEGLQRFLACVHTLSVERRLSRFCYVAAKPDA
jgi:SAM-dependent methyltransferase